MLLAEVGNKARISPLNVNWLDLLVVATSNLSLTYYIHMYILTWYQWCEKQVWMLWIDPTQEPTKICHSCLASTLLHVKAGQGGKPLCYSISPPPPPLANCILNFVPQHTTKPIDHLLLLQSSLTGISILKTVREFMWHVVDPISSKIISMDVPNPCIMCASHTQIHTHTKSLHNTLTVSQTHTHKIPA